MFLGVPGWEACCFCQMSRCRSAVTDACQAAYSSGLSARVPPWVICHNRCRAGLSSSGSMGQELVPHRRDPAQPRLVLWSKRLLRLPMPTLSLCASDCQH